MAVGSAEHVQIIVPNSSQITTTYDIHIYIHTNTLFLQARCTFFHRMLNASRLCFSGQQVIHHAKCTALDLAVVNYWTCLMVKPWHASARMLNPSGFCYGKRL